VGLLRRHLEYLAAFRAPVCLVTDLEQTTRRVSSGECLEHTDFSALLAGWPAPFARWDWPLAPPGELARDVESRHRVGAFCLVAHGAAGQDSRRGFDLNSGRSWS
jgi:hypothetical protein